MIRGNGDMESESDTSDYEGMSPLEDSDGMSSHYRLRSSLL